MTYLPNISIEDIAASCDTVSVAIRNCSSSTPASSWMAMARRAALRIAGDEDAALDQRVGVDLVPECRRDLPRAAREIDLGRALRALRLEVAREVRRR